MTGVVILFGYRLVSGKLKTSFDTAQTMHLAEDIYTMGRIYDRSGEEIRLVRQTQHAFDKAMELYEKGFYYEAKNLLACVLRENPKDMAAKYYIFRCEDLQKKN